MNTIEQILLTLIEEFHGRLSAVGDDVQREFKFPHIHNKIMVAIGMRRTGKTHFLMQVIKELLNKVPLQQILYLNFEDDRLYPLSQDKLRKLLDGFYSLHPENHTRECYIFLDEIQNVEDWALVIRRYFDSKKVKIFLSGSSAKLLSKEIATSLRGRSFAIEIWPYSFNEFLQAQGASFPNTLGQAGLDKLTMLLYHYLKNGGFPEIVSLSPLTDTPSIGGYNAPYLGYGAAASEVALAENRRQILQDYVSLVTLKDIAERYRISNILPLQYMINFLLKNSGCSISAHKMHGDLKSQGFAISKDSVHDYLAYIEDAYLAFPVPLYSESLRKVHANPRKFYAVDTGLANAFNMSFSENIGHYFENLVYLDLRRAGHHVYYYHTQTSKQKTQEVDFFSQDKMGKWHLWQACWNTEDEKTFLRETSALHAAEKELGIRGTLITPHFYFSDFLPLLYSRKLDHPGDG